MTVQTKESHRSDQRAVPFSRGLGLPIVIGLIIISVPLLFISQFLSSMDDYYYLRAWDALDTSGFEYSLRGNLRAARRDFEEARQKASLLSDPLPYLCVAENQLGEIALAKERLAEAEQHFSKALTALKRHSLNNTADERLVEDWQLMTSLNRLGYIARKHNDSEKAEQLFRQSLDLNKRLDSAGFSQEELMPFRFEKMRALLSSMELSIEKGNVRQSQEFFAESKQMDADYTYDAPMRQRMLACAQKIRQLENAAKHQETTVSMLTLPKGLPAQFDHSNLEANANEYERLAYQLMQTEARTREEDFSLIATCIKLSQYFDATKQRARAKKLLVALSCSSAVDVANSALWHDMAEELDNVDASAEALNLLKACLNSIQQRAPGTQEEAELLLTIGLRQTNKATAEEAERFLQKAYDIYKRNAVLAKQSIASVYKHLHEVANALARARLLNERYDAALKTVEESVKGRPIDQVTFDAMLIKTSALDLLNREEAMVAQADQLLRLTSSGEGIVFRQKVCLCVAAHFLRYGSATEAEKYIHAGQQASSVSQSTSNKLMLIRFNIMEASRLSLSGDTAQALSYLHRQFEQLLELEKSHIPELAQIPECMAALINAESTILKKQGDFQTATDKLLWLRDWNANFRTNYLNKNN